MRDEQSRLLFGEAYTDAMAHVAQRLRAMEKLVTGARSHTELPAIIEELINAHFVAMQVCRIIGQACDSDFGREPYSDDGSATLQRRVEPLFQADSRIIIPAETHPAQGDGLFVVLRPDLRLSEGYIQLIHNTAEQVVFELNTEGSERSDVLPLCELTQETHDRLYRALRRHVVILPEWGGQGFVRFEESAVGGAHWMFIHGSAAELSLT